MPRRPFVARAQCFAFARLLFVLAIGACEPAAGVEPSPLDASTEDGASGEIVLPNHCVDGDGDGRGPFCPGGWDCDDRDPSRAESCGTPSTGSGEACEADPSEAVECFGYPIVLEDDASHVMCQRGTRRCLGGFWTSCIFESAERVRMRLLPLRRDGREPEDCNTPCDPLCGRIVEDGENPGDDDFPDDEADGDADDSWSNVDFYPELEPYGDGTQIPAIALAGVPNTSVPDDDDDGTTDCPDTDANPNTVDCRWGDQCPMDRERDGFADGPDMDGDCIPDRCDSAPDNAAVPADRVPTIGGVRKWGCLDGYFHDGAACFTGAAAVARAAALDVPMCSILPTSMTAQEMVHTLPYLDPAGEQDSLRIQVAVKTVDVYILFDNTGSMSAERQRLQEAFRGELGTPGLIEQIRTTIPDAWFGLGAFQDFPGRRTNGTVSFNFGQNEMGVSTYHDTPYQHILDMTGSVDAVNCALQSRTPTKLAYCEARAACDLAADPAGCISLLGPTPSADLVNCSAPTGLGLETCGGWGGASDPESQMSALQSAITGNSIERRAPLTMAGDPLSFPEDVPSRDDAPLRSACGSGRYGYPCFRNSATPIFLVVTDSAIHNGPGINTGTERYPLPMAVTTSLPSSAVPCCAGTAGNCMGTTHATAVPSNSFCAYPDAMGVQETFGTAVSALVSRGARIATVWSGACPLACREECEAYGLNRCDSCSSGWRRRERCDAVAPPPNFCKQSMPLAGTVATDCTARFGPSCNANTGNALSPGFASALGDKTCSASSGYTNNCFSGAIAGGVDAVECGPIVGAPDRTRCSRICRLGTGAPWQGQYGCPVANPRSGPTPTGGYDAARDIRFYSYSGPCAGDATACPAPSAAVHPAPVCTSARGTSQGAQWYAPSANEVTSARTVWCENTGSGCPALPASASESGQPTSWIVENEHIPPSCRTSTGLRMSAPPASVNVTAYYRLSDGPPALTCAAASASGLPYTTAITVPTDSSFGSRSVMLRAGVSFTSTNVTALPLSNTVCNPRASGVAWGNTNLATAPVNTTDYGAFSGSYYTNCCVPGDIRRKAGGSPEGFVWQATDTDTSNSCPSGTESAGVEEITVNSCAAGAECNTVGGCVPSGTGGNGYSCTYKVRRCKELCGNTVTYRQRTLTCAPSNAPLQCTYYERRADCSPQCSPNAPDVCSCQRPTSGTVDVSAAACTPADPADPFGDDLAPLSAAAVAGAGGVPGTCSALLPATCNAPGTAGPSPLYCPIRNRVYNAAAVPQARQGTGAAASATCVVGAAAPPLTSDEIDRADNDACGTSFNRRGPTLSAPCNQARGCNVPADAMTAARYEPSLPGNYYCKNYFDGTGAVPRICAKNSFSAEAQQWRELARATDSVDVNGVPVFREIQPTGDGLDSSVVTAIRDLADYIRQSVALRPMQVDEYTDRYVNLPPGYSHFVDNPAVDETNFVVDVDLRTTLPHSSLTEWPNCSPAGGEYATTPTPMYRNCKPGTKTGFDVVLRNDIAPPLDTVQVFTFFVEVVAIPQASALFGGPQETALALIPVTVVVPPSSHTFVESGFYERDFDFTRYCADVPIRPTARPFYSDMRWRPSPFPPQLAGTRVVWEVWASNTPIPLPTPGSLPKVQFESPPTESSPAPFDLRAALVAQGIPASAPYLRVRTTLYSDALRTRSPFVESYEVRIDCVDSD